MENFRSSKFVQRYEYVGFDLQTPIILPGNAQDQKRTDYRFVVSNVSESYPFDWYNAYLEINFKVNKLADGSNFVAADKISTVNSGYSFINQLKADFNSVHVNDTPNINLCCHVKNLLGFFKAI